MGQLKIPSLILLLMMVSTYACKARKSESQLSNVELDRFRAEKFDRDLLLVEKELNATLTCKSDTSSASISGMAMVSPNQKRLEVNFGRATISVSDEATCHLNIYGRPLDIAGMALIKRSNSREDNLLYSSKRVRLTDVDEVEDLLDQLGVLYKLYEIDTSKVELDKNKDRGKEPKSDGEASDQTEELAPEVIRAESQPTAP